MFRVEREDKLEILEVDNASVRDAQIKRLQAVKASRDNTLVNAALNVLTSAAETGSGNLLALAIDAARVRATLGEISFALEKIFHRHKAVVKSVSGVYRSEYGETSRLDQVRKPADEFAKKYGRRPRILIAKMGQDGHDRGAKVVASAYADLGFDVDIGPLFQQPEEVARMAAENDVHVIGISSLAGGHKTLLVQLVGELKKIGRDDIMVVVGGVIPQQDYEFLRDNGAAAVFGPGTFIPDAASETLASLCKRLET
jgi:methylmalonyl-CoA mutase